MNTNNKFYVTTPIYYVTAKPHIGSLYSTLLADVAAKYNKLKGKKVFFLTGTDEHGQKIEQAALECGKNPKEFVDSFIDDYKRIWSKYNIDYNYFIRTTDESHIKAVQKWIIRLKEKGDIYKSLYEGYYCTPCETFINDKDNKVCSSCLRDAIYLSEESYFFKLSKYQDRLLYFYKNNPDFITPCERLNEVIKFVESGLKDLSISRSSIKWGIPFPDDEHHITYVWADALNNYITAVGYEQDDKEFNFWWPADLQVLGKDIIRFHAVYWPAFLMASDLKLPKKLLVHGWIKVNNQKMSKSFSNVVDPEELLSLYHPDEIRYYLIRYMVINHDSEFSKEYLNNRINSDLVNDLGNLINRILVLAKRNNFNIIKLINEDIDQELLKNLKDTVFSISHEMEIEYYFSRALNSLWKFINYLNSYIHKNEPWKIKDINKLNNVIYNALYGIHHIAILLYPVMPLKSKEILNSLGLDLNLDNNTDLIIKYTNNYPEYNISNELNSSIFKRYILNDKMMEENKVNNIENIVNITINDFSNVMLLVGQIVDVFDIEKSEKILGLKVDFGIYGVKQILSGIKKHFVKDDLINKQAVFVYNLEPKKILFLESHGMMLFAKNGDKLVFVSPVDKVENGSRLQ